MDFMEGLEILGKYGFKMFDACDWDGYAGAESFSEAVDPYYCEIERDDYSLILIWDRNGIEAYYFPNPDDDYENIYQKDAVGAEYVLMFLKMVALHQRDKTETEWILKNFFDYVK